MIRRLFHFGLVLLLLGAVMLASAVTTMHFAIHGAEIAMPDFRGLSEPEARRKAAAAGLELSVDDRFYSATVPPSRILNQSPLPGAVVRSGWHVRVSQSLGSQKVAVPAVLHEPERLAALAIRRAGLQLGTIARMPDALLPSGTVIAQTPDAGSAAVDRPNVSLLLSTSPPEAATSYVMPDFVNSTARTATDAATRAGMKLDPPLHRAAQISAAPAIPGEALATPVPTGTVLEQRPAAGSRIAAGATIQFTLAQ